MMKKYSAYLFILIIGLGFGMGLTYLQAYNDPQSNALTNNNPAPILIDDITGDMPFSKWGKLGITVTGTTLDSNAFNSNALVVGGQMASNSLAVSGDTRIYAELPTTSVQHALRFGDSTNSSFSQLDLQNHPRVFTVEDHTRVARVVVGPSSGDPAWYNLYLNEESTTNLGDFKNSSYCTLNATQLKDKGCPSDYLGEHIPTYMRQIIGTGSGATAQCYMLTPFNPAKYGTGTRNRGVCYYP